MSWPEYKYPGLCTRCETPVYEIIERWPLDHPLARSPRRIGPVTRDAWKVSLVLSDESRADLTFCTECAAALTEADFPELWALVCRTNAREITEEYRKAINPATVYRPYTARQREAVEATIRRLTAAHPTSILSKEAVSG